MLHNVHVSLLARRFILFLELSGSGRVVQFSNVIAAKMEIIDPTTDVNFLIVGDGFYKNFLIFNKISSAFFPLISIVIELESIINSRNSFF